MGEEQHYYFFLCSPSGVTEGTSLGRHDDWRQVTDFSKNTQDKTFLDTLVLETKTLRFIGNYVTIFQSTERNIPEYWIFKASTIKRGGELFEIILPKIMYCFLMRMEMYN